MRKAFSMFLAAALLAEAALGSIGIFNNKIMATEAKDNIDSVTEHEAVSGDLSLKIAFAVPEVDLDSRDMVVTLHNEDGSIVGEIDINDFTQTAVGDYKYEMSFLNADGTPISYGEEVCYLDINIQSLPLGTYKFGVSGNKFSSFTSDDIVIDTHSKAVVLYTNGAGFSLGDVDGDGTITQLDLESVIADLSSSDFAADLNNDGIVDIVDLAIVNRILDNEDLVGQEIFNTSAILKTVIEDIIISGGEVIAGDLANEGFVTIKSDGEISPDNRIDIEIPFASEIETQQIQFTIPSELKALTGEVFVTYIEDGVEITKAFELDEIFGLVRSVDESGNVVVINLGTKVAVKKVTISVTSVSDAYGNVDYVTISDVTFLEDIVPANPVTNQSLVTGLTAKASDAEISLLWNRAVNITGYNVYMSDTYSTDLADYTLVEQVATESATISKFDNEKLENGTTYYFMVTSTSGTWESGSSNVVSATPETAKLPTQVQSVSLRAGDSEISVSYKEVTNADTYNIYYRAADNDYIKVSDVVGASYTITGLTNDVMYDVYVTAQNDLGEGPASTVYQATPFEEIISDPGVPKTNLISASNIASARLINTSNIGDFYNDEFDIGYVYDEDYETHWTAQVWYKDGTVEFTFHEPYEMDYLVWVPRLDGIYSNSMGAHWQGNGSYKISIWEDGDDLDAAAPYTLSDAIATKVTNADGKSYYVLPFEKSNVAKIQVANGIYAGAPTVTSLSEIHFYEYDSLADDIADLFTDITFTEINPHVTQQMIDELVDRLGDESSYHVNHNTLSNELKLAQNLLDNNTDALGVVFDGLNAVGGLQPLGLTGKAGETVTIYADIPQGETVTVVPTKFYAENTAWKGEYITLTSGRNEITLPNIVSSTNQGGVLYYSYNGNRADEIKLHAIHHSDETEFNKVAVKQMPVLELFNWFDMTETERRTAIESYITFLETYVNELKLWDSTLADNYYNATEISMPYVLLSMPADAILNGIGETLTLDEKIDKVYDNTEAWIEFMEIMFTTYGVDEADFMDQTRQNIRYMQMFTGAFMYAAGSHVGIEHGSCAPLIQGVPTAKGGRNTFGWGIAHEVGHNLDTIGYVEVTNNIYSLFAQVWDDDMQANTSRVPFDDVFEKVSAQTVGASNNVFVELGMYWQLHLAYDGVYEIQEDNFFYNFNKLYRAGAYSDYTKDDRIAIISSIVANRDLSDFFASWGKTLSADAVAQMSTYQSEPRQIQYLNDESRALRLNGAKDITSISSNVTATSEFIEFSDISGGEVEISVSGLSTSEKEALQGFRVYKNGQSVGFMNINSLSFSDQIGAANNLSYEYTLVPITKLGMALDEIDAGQVKISYDVTVPKDSFSAEIIGDDIVINFVQTTTSSGIRLGDYPNTTDKINVYTAQVVTTSSAISLEDTAPVMSSEVVYDKLIETVDFDSNDSSDDDKFIAYFNKPGAPVADKRIWNYDLDTVAISGVSDKEAFIEALNFIQYPGDNIEFNTDTVMGIMGHDYIYDASAGADGMIAEGTVVIVGTYRGDPVYNTVFMKGRFLEIDHTYGTSNEVERYINGESILFAEVPQDGEVSETSDGLFIFIPDVQAEANLGCQDHDHDHGHEEGAHNHIDSIFPVHIQAELKRSDDPYYASVNDRNTSTTNWVVTPSYATLPTIVLE